MAQRNTEQMKGTQNRIASQHATNPSSTTQSGAGTQASLHQTEAQKDFEKKMMIEENARLRQEIEENSRKSTEVAAKILAEEQKVKKEGWKDKREKISNQVDAEFFDMDLKGWLNEAEKLEGVDAEDVDLDEL